MHNCLHNYGVSQHNREEEDGGGIRSPASPRRKLRLRGLKMERVWLPDLAESSVSPCPRSDCQAVLAGLEEPLQLLNPVVALQPQTRHGRCPWGTTLHHSPPPCRCFPALRFIWTGCPLPPLSLGQGSARNAGLSRFGGLLRGQSTKTPRIQLPLGHWSTPRHVAEPEPKT